MEKKNDYRITPINYKYRTYMWDAETEVLLSLFVKKLCKIRPHLNYNTVTKEILEKYVRKTQTGVVSATKIMREVLK